MATKRIAIRLSVKDFRGIEDLVRADSAARFRAVRDGMLEGAAHGADILRDRSPEDLGQLRNSWGIERRGRIGVNVINDAPHAGVVEGGARPHPVSEEGRMNILWWVSRKFPGLAYDEMVGIMQGIVRKLRKHGQKPTWFVLRSLPELVALLKTKVEFKIHNIPTPTVAK